MQELKGIAEWLAHGPPHHLQHVDSLPAPTFFAGGKRQVSFSTNNYLALATSARLVRSAKRGLETYGVGNCESRLLGGNLELYDELENKLAKLKSKPSSILFATGYLANLGVLSSLPRTGQYARIYGYRSPGKTRYAYLSDEFSHLSIREGIRMSGADRFTFRHCDLDHLESLLRKCEADCKIIVTDGVFSQDGDIAPLPGLLDLAERYDALVYVDDAHGTGVLGPNGSGTSDHFGVKNERLIQMGTLSKAYGAIGGFIATEHYIAEILRLSCGAYGFTSTLPPDQAAAVMEAIDMSVDEPWRRQRLWDNQRYFVERMKTLPYTLVSTETPIVPILIGPEALTEKLAAVLRDEKIHVDSVKFPAVPMHKSRLRVQLNAGHTRGQIDHLIDVLETCHDQVDEQRQSGKQGRGWRQIRVQETSVPWAAAAFSGLSAVKDNALSALGRKWRGVSATLLTGQISLAAVVLATALLVAVDIVFDVPHLIFAYLLPILFVARRFGQFEAVSVTAVYCSMAAFFYYSPRFSIYIDDIGDFAELASFGAISLLMIQCFAGGRRMARVRDS